VVLALEEQTKKPGKEVFVPFRDSALTLFLKECFAGSTHIDMIFTVNFAKNHFDESMTTLKFAMRCRNIKIREAAVPINAKESDDQVLILQKFSKQATPDVQELV